MGPHGIEIQILGGPMGPQDTPRRNVPMGPHGVHIHVHTPFSVWYA